MKKNREFLGQRAVPCRPDVNCSTVPCRAGPWAQTSAQAWHLFWNGGSSNQQAVPTYKVRLIRQKTSVINSDPAFINHLGTKMFRKLLLETLTSHTCTNTPCLPAQRTTALSRWPTRDTHPSLPLPGWAEKDRTERSNRKDRDREIPSYVVKDWICSINLVSLLG